MGKLPRLRWVCAPQREPGGTVRGPNASVSTREGRAEMAQSAEEVAVWEDRIIWERTDLREGERDT